MVDALLSEQPRICVSPGPGAQPDDLPDLAALTRRLRGLADAEGITLTGAPEGAWVTVSWLGGGDGPGRAAIGPHGRALLARCQLAFHFEAEVLGALGAAMAALCEALHLRLHRLPDFMTPRLDRLDRALLAEAAPALARDLGDASPTPGSLLAARVRGALQLLAGSLERASLPDWSPVPALEVAIQELLPLTFWGEEEDLEEERRALSGRLGAGLRRLDAAGADLPTALARWAHTQPPPIKLAAYGEVIDLGAARSEEGPLRYRRSSRPEALWLITETRQAGALVQAVCSGALDIGLMDRG